MSSRAQMENIVQFNLISVLAAPLFFHFQFYLFPFFAVRRSFCLFFFSLAARVFFLFLSL